MSLPPPLCLQPISEHGFGCPLSAAPSGGGLPHSPLSPGGGCCVPVCPSDKALEFLSFWLHPPRISSPHTLLSQRSQHCRKEIQGNERAHDLPGLTRRLRTGTSSRPCQDSSGLWALSCPHTPHGFAEASTSLPPLLHFPISRVGDPSTPSPAPPLSFSLLP